MNLRNAFVLFWACIPLLVGCEQSPEDHSSPLGSASTNSLQAMRLAVRQQEWEDAWKLSNAVLTEHADDPTTVTMVARVAYELGDLNTSADLMIGVCEMEAFADSSRTKQTLASLAAAGRVYEGVELLTTALTHHPNQFDIRRLLYDLLCALEERPESLPHGKTLVRERQFNIPLLLSLSRTEKRGDNADPMLEMARRNADDQRPLIAVAKTQLDDGETESAIATLHKSLQRHPHHAPAKAILSRALIENRDFEEFEKLASSASEKLKRFPAYWIALGDWAKEHQQISGAMRCYWEAASLDPSIREAWAKLSASLSQAPQNELGLSQARFQAVNRRVLLLTRFNQVRSEFEKLGSRSSKHALQLAEILFDLGKPWEAEAWASVAMTLPKDEHVNIDALRRQIIQSLHSTTPWQITNGHLEFSMDLSSFPLPKFETRKPSKNSGTKNSGTKASRWRSVSVPNVTLRNEADLRSLNFFGRTHDKLDEPGVMLHQTLGCGGGTLDFDRDGWSDLYLAAARGTPGEQDSDSNALFRNTGGSFVEITTRSGTTEKGFGQGIAVGDINEDGFPDLLILNYGPNTVLVNNGDGTFQDASDSLLSSEAPIETAWSASGAIADLNADGLADLAVVNYCEGMLPATKQCAQEKGIVRACSPITFAGYPDQFFVSDGQGHFVNQTKNWNAIPFIVGRGLGIAIGSLDSTPGNDVFVANDMSSNHYWNADVSGASFQLTESAIPQGVGAGDRSSAQGSMGIATGDFDHDGDIDLYVTNFVDEPNVYHEQTIPGLWTDQTSRIALEFPTLAMVGFGTEAIDLDNDGNLELVVSNGHVDFFPSRTPPTPYAQPMQIFHRTKEGRFAQLPLQGARDYLAKHHIGRALWDIDANRDGKSDLVVTHQSESVGLLINATTPSGNWITLQLSGVASSRDAVGAIVNVDANEKRWTFARVAGGGYLCSNDPLIRVGLGAEDAPCCVEVQWPSGKNEQFSDLDINQEWLLVEGDGQGYPL